MMKTSNKLLLTATLIMFGYLVIYDFQLKAQYLKADYKNIFYNMERSPLNSFTAIVNNEGNNLNINIKKGPRFEIWIDKNIKDKIAIGQRNNTLSIDAKDKNIRYYQTGITIICPYVNTITTNPHPLTNWQNGNGKTTITGFTQGELNINANKFTEIELKNNSLDILNAGTGSSNAAITVQDNNQIKAANFKIIGKSDLRLFNPGVNNAYTYSYTDSATITLNGKAFNKIQH